MAQWEELHWSGRPREPANRKPRLTPNAFARIARACAEQCWAIIAIYLMLALAAAAYAGLTLRLDPEATPEFTFDTAVSEPGRELASAFPGLESTIYGVVTGDNPDEARSRAQALADVLSARKEILTSAFVPGSGSFYDRFGILFEGGENITARVAAIQQMMPLYHALAAAPDMLGLAALVSEIGKAVEQGRSPPGLEGLLRRVTDVIEAEVAGASRPLDWPALAGLSARASSPTWYVIATPVPGQERAAATFAREQAASLKGVTWLWPSRSLADGTSLIGSFAVPVGLALLVSITLLAAGLGSIRLTLPVLLASGTVTALAAGAAAVVTPQLDGATWSFAASALAPAVLLATILVVAYQQARHRGAVGMHAIMLAAHRRGPMLLLVATIFLAFWLSWLIRRIPSLADFALIALLATLAALAVALTLVPAAIAVVGGRGRDVSLHWLDEAGGLPGTSNGRNMLQVAGMVMLAAGAFCAVFLPGTKFGEKLTEISPPPLLDTPDSRGAVHVLAKPGEDVATVVKTLATLPEVGAIRWVEQFLPVEAAAKIETLKGLEGQFAIPAEPRPVGDTEAISDVFAELETGLRQIADGAATDPGLRDAALRLRRAFSLLANPELPSPGRLLALEDALFSGLTQLSQSADALARLSPPTLADLDPPLRERFVAPDGRWRIEVMPRPGIGSLTFAASVRRTLPAAAGEPVQALLRNEVIHHEAGLAFAAALTAAVLLSFAALRDPWRWLATLPAFAFFFTFIAAAMAGLGIALNAAMLAALSIGAALSIASAILMAEGLDTRRAAAPERVGLLPVAVMLGAVLPLALSTHRAVADYGLVAGLILAIVLVLNAILIPAGVLWFGRFHWR